VNVKVLFWIGLVVLILGIASLVVPIPHTDREGLTVGDVSIGVEAKHTEKISPAVSAVMILCGLGAIVVGRSTAS
jgi:hypothetical protein